MKGGIVKGFICILIFFLSLLCTACASQQTSGPEKDQVRFLIGVSQANLVEPWRVTMNEEIKEEALKHKDIRLVFTDAAQSSQRQIKDVEQLLQLGIDLLIISPNDSSELTPIVAEAYKKIPVIVLDRGVEGYDYTLYIGPDNRSIGREAGKYVSELLGGARGRVVEIRGPENLPSVKERSLGFREEVGQHENIEIVSVLGADWQRDKAEDQMAELLEKDPQVDIVFAHSDYMALGAYKAAQKRGMKHIHFVGIDGSSGPAGGLQQVEDGILKGTFTCLTGGRESIQYALDILHHERGIPKKIIPRSYRITQENVKAYVEKRKEPPTGKDLGKRKILLGFSQVGAESDWRKTNSQSIKVAAQNEGIDLIFMEADQQQKNQVAAIRSFIAQGVDVIAFSPVVENGWTEVLEEARAAGIPVILSDRAIKPDDNSLYQTFIGSEFLEEGRRAARWLLKKHQEGQKANIVELEGTVGSAPAVDRKKGFSEILTAYPHFKVVYSASGAFTQEGGKAVMGEALSIYGNDIQVVYAHNDDMALGAIQAIEEFGLKPGRDILIVSIDATEAAFKAMLDGKLNCTVECTPFLGPQLMQAVKTLMAGRQLPARIIPSEGVFPAETARQDYRNRRY